MGVYLWVNWLARSTRALGPNLVWHGWRVSFQVVLAPKLCQCSGQPGGLEERLVPSFPCLGPSASSELILSINKEAMMEKHGHLTAEERRAIHAWAVTLKKELVLLVHPISALETPVAERSK